MNKVISKRLIGYELKSASGNIWSIIFGLFMPIIYGVIIYKAYVPQVTESVAREFATGLYMSMAVMAINAILLIGYAANLSLELEQKVTLRLNLFGISNRTIVMSKLIAQLSLFIICYLIYTISFKLLVGFELPTINGLFIYMLSVFIISIISFVMAHGIANIFQKFGPTYAITMFIMLGTMFLSGVMGIQVENLPKAVQKISYLLPYTYLTKDFYKVWMGKSYNFVPFIQSILFFGGLSIIILLFSFYYRRRK